MKKHVLTLEDKQLPGVPYLKEGLQYIEEIVNFDGRCPGLKDIELNETYSVEEP